VLKVVYKQREDKGNAQVRGEQPYYGTRLASMLETQAHST